MAFPQLQSGDFLGLDGFVPSAALGVEKPEQFLQGVSICPIANECLFPLCCHDVVVLQLLEMMGERRAANTDLCLDFVDDHAVWVR